jgi:prevent-host-death family protein
VASAYKSDGLVIRRVAAACADASDGIARLAILATNRFDDFDGRDMQTLSARDAKYNFGRLIDMARAEPVTVEKHGRAVVVVLAVEEYERLAGAAARELEKGDKPKKRDE